MSDLGAAHSDAQVEEQERADALAELKSRPEELIVERLDSPYLEKTKQIASQLGASRIALNRWWVLTPTDWTCPSCTRPKADFARVTAGGALFGEIHEHHDHMADVVTDRFISAAVSKAWPDLTERALHFAKRLAPMVSAYDPTLICADCNAADANAKKLLGAPAAFSFAPDDIAQFIVVRANQVHEIDRDRALGVWNGLSKTFGMRLKVLDRMIEIALNDEHWFRPSPLAADPEYVERRARSQILLLNHSLELRGWPADLFDHDTYAAMMKAVRVSGKTNQTWRTHTVQDLGRAVTSQDAAYLEVSDHSALWKAVTSDWVCPCCGRTKIEIIQPSKKFKISFSVWTRRPPLGERNRTTLCGECNWAIKGIAKEAEVEPTSVSLQDIRDCVISRPNRSHEVRRAGAVDVVIERVRARRPPAEPEKD